MRANSPCGENGETKIMNTTNTTAYITPTYTHPCGYVRGTNKPPENGLYIVKTHEGYQIWEYKDGWENDRTPIAWTKLPLTELNCPF